MIKKVSDSLQWITVCVPAYKESGARCFQEGWIMILTKKVQLHFIPAGLLLSIKS